MVKRSVTKVKKESKMKQKQRQQQNVTVNIGTLAKKPRARKPTKPPQAPQNPIVTRGPTTFYQQPQPAPQPIQSEGRSINELYKLIKQQAQEKQPEQQPITTSIVPPPKVEEILKAVNELERVRKARVAKFEKPELEKVFEEQQEGDGLEGKAYQEFNQFNKFKSMTQLFREAEKEEPEVSLLSEGRSAPSFNLFPSGRIVPDYVAPNLSLHASSLFAPPPPNLTSADTDTNDDSTPRQQQAFLDLFSNSPSLEPKQTSHSLVSDVVGSTAPPPTPERETFEEEVFNPEFVEETEKVVPFEPEPPYEEEEESAQLNVVNVQPLINPDNVPFIDTEAGESKEGITEIKVGEAVPPTPPPKKAIYKGSPNLPPIVQPRAETTPLAQLLSPSTEPSLIAEIAGDVRAPDEYRTERLVKGQGAEIPEAAAEYAGIVKATNYRARSDETVAIKKKWDELNAVLKANDYDSRFKTKYKNEAGVSVTKRSSDLLADIHTLEPNWMF